MEKYKIRKGYTCFIANSIFGDRKRILRMLDNALDECIPFDILCPTFLDPKGLIFYCGGGFTPNEKIPYPEGQGEMFINQYPVPREVEFSPFWAFVISDEALKKLKPIPRFDRDIFLHADFALTVQKKGFKIKVTNKWRVKYKDVYNIARENKKWIKKLTNFRDKFLNKWTRFLDNRWDFPIMFHTHTGYPGGYNMHARCLLKALANKGVRIYYKFIGGCNDDEPLSNDFLIDDLRCDMGSMRMPQVTLSTGLNCFSNSGKYKIGFTTTEVDGIPQDWVKVLNEMNEVWTTSEFAKQSIKRSGVKRSVLNMREGVDPNYFHPDIKPFKRNVKQKFIFLSNFAWGRRKGVDILFKAFEQEFSRKNDVVLIIKALPSYYGEDIKKEAKKLYYRKGQAPIIIWDATIPPYLLGGLYTVSSCFVFPTRGEGFGIPPLEALACGVPVITTGYSAQTEYLIKNGKPLPGVEFINYKIKKFDGSDSVYYDGFNWAIPDVNHLRKLMRKVYNNYEEYKKGAMESSEYIRKEWTWDKCADLVIKRIKKLKMAGKI